MPDDGDDSQCNGHDCLDDEVQLELAGTQYAPGEALDKSDGKTRLVLSYDSTADAFTGTVTNTTQIQRLTSVEVVVYLDSHESRSGPALLIDLTPVGPAPLPELDPGQAAEVSLPVDGIPFTAWSAELNYSPVGFAPDTGIGGLLGEIRFSLDYNPTANAFIAAVENITGHTLASVTVEVSLYNFDGSDDRDFQVTSVDLAPGEVSEITLPVDGDPFIAWSGQVTSR